MPDIRKAAAAHKDLEIRERVEAAILAIMRRSGTSKSTGLKMALIEAGGFRMGDPGAARQGRGELAHGVGITHPFLLGIHEVTQDLYRRVMAAEPSGFSMGGDREAKIKGMETGTFPVEEVAWFDCLEFCNRLSRLDGYPPCYELTDVKREGDSITGARATIVGGNGYRLPTEAQWEYACRAGTVGMYHYGERNTGREANLRGRTSYASGPSFKSLDRPAKVGSYPANAWGLYDMHGNVGEWCWDWYGKDYYGQSPPSDPQGPDRGDQRVVRGGSWLDAETACRSASRFWLTPDERKDHVGFRVARMP